MRVLFHQESASKIGTTISGNYIKPFVDIKFEPLPIVEIILGPKIDRRRGSMGLQALLQSMSHNDVQIKTSSIPYF